MEGCTSFNAIKAKARLSRAFFVTAIVSTLAACGGGGDTPATPPPPPAASTGDAAVVIGDAAGSFYSYAVNVTSLKLKPASGAEVETLSAPVRIDFTQLENLSELLATHSLPVGNFTAVHMLVDYTGASIVAPDGTGAPQTLTPKKADGTALTTLDLVVNLSSPLVITANHVSPIALDFDIASSNLIEGANVVVLPLMTATVTPSATRVHRVDGQLTALNTTGTPKTLTVHLRPMDMAGGDLGTATVIVNDATVYDVNGTSATGAPGLTALNAVARPTAVSVLGTLSSSTGTITATSVRAGSSVAGSTSDEAQGTVLARSGDVVTVLGSVRNHTTGTRTFSNALQVTITGADVARDDGATSLTLADVSVGTRISALGTCSSACTATHVLVLPTRVEGSYNDEQTITTENGSRFQMELNLTSINNIPVQRFDFTGTDDTANSFTDANPANYVIGIPALITSAFGAPVSADGFVGPFAGQNQVDFTATSTADPSTVPARLLLSWTSPGSDAALASSNADGMVFDLSDPSLGNFHDVYRLDQVTDLAGGTNPTVVPASSGFKGCALIDVTAGTITTYPTFAAFTTALNTSLGGTPKLRAFSARGSFADDTTTVTAQSCGAIVQ